MYVWYVCTGCIYISYEQVAMLIGGKVESKVGAPMALFPLERPRADKREAVPFKNRGIIVENESPCDPRPSELSLSLTADKRPYDWRVK